MCIYSIFGYGKGKTESGIGIAIRAASNDESVLFAQFLKDGNSSEISYLNEDSRIKTISSGTSGIVLPQNKTEDDTKSCGSLYRDVFNYVATGGFDLVVLDEILVAIDMGLISFTMLDLLIKTCRENDTDVYMTGRIRNANTRQKIIDISDCASNVYCEKHMFNRYCSNCHNDFPFHYTYCPDCGSELETSKPCKVGRDY